MTFRGSLEDLSTIDIIQLVHVSKKSGTVQFENDDKKASIAFRDGDIIGVTHPMSRMNIGFILVEMGAVSKSQILQALKTQDNSPLDRKPLVTTLIELGHLSEQVGWQALSRLVEETIIEVVTWEKGVFSYELDEVKIFDDFKYFPANVINESSFDTQNLLLEAMRILDETGQKLTLAPNSLVETPHDEPVTSPAPGPIDLDESECPTAPPARYPQQVSEILGRMSEQEELDLLASIDQSIHQVIAEHDAEYRKVILISDDPQLIEIAEEVCRVERVDLIVDDYEKTAVEQLKYWLSENHFPVAVIDLIDWDRDPLTSAQYQPLMDLFLRRYPEIPIVVLGPGDPEFTAEAFSRGARVVLRRPRVGGLARSAEELQYFPSSLAGCLNNLLTQPDILLRQLLAERKQMASLKHRVSEICMREGYQDVTLVVLRYVAEYLSRCMIFLVRKDDLLALGSFGLADGTEDLARLIMKLSVPSDPSILHQVIEEGVFFLGTTDSDPFNEILYKNFPQPENPEVILFPLRVENKTIAVIYGDFGTNPTSRIQTDALEILANNAGLALSLELVKKKSRSKLLDA